MNIKHNKIHMTNMFGVVGASTFFASLNGFNGSVVHFQLSGFYDD